MNTHSTGKRGRSQSLVSLLVGVVVAMIAILGMVLVFHMMVRNGLESSADIRAAREVSLAMLTTHLHLHDAGYGLEATDDGLGRCTNTTLDLNTHTLLVSGCANVVGTGLWPRVTTLLWRFAPGRDGSHICAGLHTSGQGFYYLTPIACSPSGWPDTAWTLQMLMKETGNKPSLAIAVSRFTNAVSACKALGIAGEGGVSITLSSMHSSSGTELASTTCLVNFPI